MVKCQTVTRTDAGIYRDQIYSTKGVRLCWALWSLVLFDPV